MAMDFIFSFDDDTAATATNFISHATHTALYTISLCVNKISPSDTHDLCCGTTFVYFLFNLLLPDSLTYFHQIQTIKMTSDADTMKKELLELSAQRDQLELKSKSALAFLQSTPVGVTGKLIDEEGFPRADVDIYAVREARHTLACNKNDLIEVMNAMQKKLEQLHEATREETVRSLGGAVRDPNVRGQSSSEAKPLAENKISQPAAPRPAPDAPKAFLVVAAVAPNSPAAIAGLRAGDHIHKFGDVGFDLFAAEGMQSLAAFTRANEGQTVAILVSTPDISTQLLVEHFIVPRRWAGNGLIGAEFDPIVGRQ
eukprot:GILI01020449.1.p1 GENE.GILI01020449.1~~GILI01020449.1.p1  ORF type:complete len:313 (+),score=47.65 GILI01020449.1:967-1905(+)